jgi:hypothetical protein
VILIFLSSYQGLNAMLARRRTIPVTGFGKVRNTESKAVMLNGMTIDHGASLIRLPWRSDLELPELPKNAEYTIGKK